jgi:integrase
MSTVCGYDRFAHIDGRIPPPAQYVRGLRVHPPVQRGMDRGKLASFLYTAEQTSPMHAALAALLGLNGLRVSEACGTNIEDLGFERATASCASSARASERASGLASHRSHRRPGDRRTQPGPILSRHNGERFDTRTACRRMCSVGTSRAWPGPSTHVAGGVQRGRLGRRSSLRDLQIAARRADPLGLTRFDGQVDYAASAALWWWIFRDSYSAGVR